MLKEYLPGMRTIALKVAELVSLCKLFFVLYFSNIEFSIASLGRVDNLYAGTR